MTDIAASWRASSEEHRFEDTIPSKKKVLEKVLRDYPADDQVVGMAYINLATSYLGEGMHDAKTGDKNINFGKRMLQKGLAICQKTLEPGNEFNIIGHMKYPLCSLTARACYFSLLWSPVVLDRMLV